MGQAALKFFIDECLSPELATRLNAAGYHAVHPRDYGRTGELDHEVLQRCLDEDLTIVTENAVDFRRLIGATELHPGLIILPSVSRERSWSLLETAIDHLKVLGDPAQQIVNHVIEVARNGRRLFTMSVRRSPVSIASDGRVDYLLGVMASSSSSPTTL